MPEQSPAFAQMDSLAYVQGKPVASAILKQNFTDFIVDEELGFEPSGSGDHVLVRLRKQDISTTELANQLARSAGISSRDVGYSGMKDRRGECSQWFSLKLAGKEPAQVRGALSSLESDSVQVLDWQRNHRKLRVGSHRANRFKLLLRDCSGPHAAFEERLQHLALAGMPNYFGPQRFGRDFSNMQQVLAFFQGLEDESGANQAPGKSESSRDNRAATSKGRKRQGKKHGMLLSAARAYVFNQILSERIREQSWNRYVAGDVLNLDGTDRLFAVGADAWDEPLEQRLQTFDIHPTGLLPGVIKAQDKYLTVGRAADIENAVCQNYPQLVTGLMRQGVEASRRPLRCRVMDLQWSWPTEKELRVQFTLPRGAYATSMLREVCELREVEGLHFESR